MHISFHRNLDARVDAPPVALEKLPAYQKLGQKQMHRLQPDNTTLFHIDTQYACCALFRTLQIQLKLSIYGYAENYSTRKLY